MQVISLSLDTHLQFPPRCPHTSFPSFYTLQVRVLLHFIYNNFINFVAFIFQFYTFVEFSSLLLVMFKWKFLFFCFVLREMLPIVFTCTFGSSFSATFHFYFVLTYPLTIHYRSKRGFILIHSQLCLHVLECLSLCFHLCSLILEILLSSLHSG